MTTQQIETPSETEAETETSTPEAASEAAASQTAANETDQPDREAAAQRRRIERELAELERKQAELKRALAMTNHPDLADAIREVEGRAYGVSRVEEQLAQPLSKSEERQRAKLEKKLADARDKRAAFDAQIEALDAELKALSDDRVDALREKRATALHALFATIARHSEGFEAAGLQVTELVPELDAWLPELRAMAEDVADAE